MSTRIKIEFITRSSDEMRAVGDGWLGIYDAVIVKEKGRNAGIWSPEVKGEKNALYTHNKGLRSREQVNYVELHLRWAVYHVTNLGTAWNNRRVLRSKINSRSSTA